MSKNIAVYCSSSNSLADQYYSDAKEVALEMIKMGASLIFGGGRKGLMGAMADTFLSHQGKITGVMPNFMKDVEWHHEGISDFIFTANMSDRKNLMIEKADAVIALPGGMGTVEELTEVISLKRLGLFFGPIVVLNSNGFYNPLIELMENMVKENFMRKEHLKIWSIAHNPVEAVQLAIEEPYWPNDARSFAGL